MTEHSRPLEERGPDRPNGTEPVITDTASTTDQTDLAQPHTDSASPADRKPGRFATWTRAVLNRPLPFVIAGVVLIVLLLTGMRYFRYASTHEWTDDAFIEGHIIQISPKVSGHIERVYATDNQEVKRDDLLLEIDPEDYEVRLAQRRAAWRGAVAKQQATQSRVDLMRVTLEADIQQAQSGVELAQSVVQTARAQVVTARSQLDQARAQVEAARANAAQEQAQIEAAVAEAARAGADVKRARDLSGNDQIVSRRELDHAINDVQIADAKLEAARRKAAATAAQVDEARAAQKTAADMLHYLESQIREAEARVGEAMGRLAAANAAPYQMSVYQAQADTAGAEVAQAQAAVDQARLDLEATKIYAPQAGRVTRKNVEPGAYVQVGQALLTIVPHEVWVVANFMETQLNQIQPGQPVEIEVDAYPGQTFQGHVDSIQAGTGARFSLLPPENATGNFVKVVQRIPVKIMFDQVPDSAYPLSPGMSVIPVVQIR